MKIALVGNQNSGKTTLFNLLTGTNQKVGNWPGVTVERKSGIIKGTNLEIVDLPGVYSLSPYTQEEVVSRDYVILEKPELIINIVDATNIERSLYLTTQLLELDTNVIIVLNMEDELAKKKIHIDVEKLSHKLNTSVVKISALKNTGVDELIKLIQNDTYIKNEHKKIFLPNVEKVIDIVNIDVAHKRFIAIKTLEREERYSSYVTNEIKDKVQTLEEVYGYDIEQVIANQRYQYIVDIKSKTIIHDENHEPISEKLDKVFLNKYAAIPIFAVIMFLIYYLSVGVVGTWTVDLVDTLISNIATWFGGVLKGWNASDWAISLICDGIISGVGAVLNFVPQLMILFMCISILETSGYMSRIAFFLDKLFRKFGLSGKSLIPFIVGSGCSVPGIMSSRTVEDDDEKTITVICTPFIPCSAKLPIIALFGGAFFDKYSGLITASLYFLAIIVILLSAFIMKKFFFKGDPASFISELPEFKAPSIKYVFRDVFDKTLAFFKRAGTVILVCSVLVWALLSFTFKGEYIESNYQKEIDVNLTELALSKDIIYNKERVENKEVTTVITQDDLGQLFVSFGTLQDDGTYTYTEKIIIDNVTTSNLKVLLGNNNDNRKSLIVSVNNEKIVYGYSLTLENSILASIGKKFSWIFYPMLGELNWGATVSTVQGLVAKEQVVSSMAIIAGFNEDVTNGNIIFNSKSFNGFTPLSAYSFMVFNLFSAPCFGAIGAMRKELGTTKKTLIAVAFQTGLAWALATLIFGIGSLIALI